MEYIDLGLPSGTKWAASNVGGNSHYEKNAEEWIGTHFYETDKEKVMKMSLPTVAQWKELVANTTHEITNLAGGKTKAQMVLRSKVNDNFVVFPYTGPSVYIDAQGNGLHLYDLNDEELKIGAWNLSAFHVREVSK